MSRVAFIFPGQGAQYVGMGKELYDVLPEVKDIFKRADEILGLPLTKYCFEGPAEILKNTSVCQPAILLVSIAALEALRLKLNAIRSTLNAKFVAGLSLGEYTALYAAGVFSLEDVLRVVRRRAELMDEAAKKHSGKMAAILGLDKEKLKQICKKTGAEIANLNCPGQVVITGKIDSVDSTKKLANQEGAKAAVDLEISGAFHSSSMKEAAEEFGGFLAGVSMNEPKIPIIANVNAQPQFKSSQIRENLVKQIYSCVYFEQSIQYISSQGVKTFLEIGPGKILKGLLRRIDPSLKVINIEKPADISSLQI